MSIRHLPFFAVAAEERNFSRAAIRLHITQPALSRRMQDLEASVGFRLFERHHNRIDLTPAGEMLAAEASRLVEDLDAAIRRIRMVNDAHKESLTIGFNEHSMRIAALTSALRSFRQIHPEIHVAVRLMSSAHQLAALQDGSLDIALLYLPNAPVPLVKSREVLNDDPYVVALLDTDPLIKLDPLKLADLEGAELIWPSSERVPALYSKLDAAWRAAGIEPLVSIEIESAEAALNAVAAGLGIAVVRNSNAGHEPPGVRLRRAIDLDICLRASVCWLDQITSHARESFLQVLVQQGVTRE